MILCKPNTHHRLLNVTKYRSMATFCFNVRNYLFCSFKELLSNVTVTFHHPSYNLFSFHVGGWITTNPRDVKKRLSRKASLTSSQGDITWSYVSGCLPETGGHIELAWCSQICASTVYHNYVSVYLHQFFLSQLWWHSFCYLVSITYLYNMSFFLECDDFR